MEFIKKQMHINRMEKGIADQFFVDDDYNVPDAKRDVAKIVMSKGEAKVEEIKPLENYVRVTGNVYFQILYVTEEGETKLTSLMGKTPFEEMVYVENGVEDGEYAVRNLRTEFTASMIHSRKLSVKALVELEIGKEVTEDISLTTEIESEDTLYKKKKEHQLLQLHTGKRDTYRIKEEVVLAGTKENMGMILWTDVTNRKLDTKLEEDALHLSGELSLFCLYESPEGKTDWIEQAVAYEGQVNCSGVDPSMYHYITGNLSEVNVDMRADEDGEMRSIGIEGTLDLKIAVYEEEEAEVLEDVYSLQHECNLKREKVRSEELVLQNHSKCKLSEQLSVPELREDILQICYNSGEVQVEKMERGEQGIQIEGILHLQFLYVKESDEVPFDTWQGMIPFSYLIECDDMNEDTIFDVNYGLEQLSVSMLGSGEVEVKAVLAFHSFIRRQLWQNVITDMETIPFDMEKIGKEPGIVGYIVKEGDELWDLAKQYRTTAERIQAANGLSGEEIKEGDKILIFKENMSIL